MSKGRNKSGRSSNRKANLPTKVCPTCDRPFTWRKKWERNWENVVYCSKRCRGEGNNPS